MAPLVGLETKPEAGFYLFAVGSLIAAAAFLIFCLGLKNLTCGKISPENISLGKQKNNGRESQQSEPNLQKKLEELQTLKESGLITEQEFSEKREDLLREFK